MVKQCSVRGWDMESGCQMMMSLFLLCCAVHLWGQMVLEYICQLSLNVLCPREESTLSDKNTLQTLSLCEDRNVIGCDRFVECVISGCSGSTGCVPSLAAPYSRILMAGWEGPNK